MRRLVCSLLVTGMGLVLLAAERPAPLCAQGGARPGPVEIVLDASSGMAGALGDGDRIAAARALLGALADGLAVPGGAAPGLRVYGGREGDACGESRWLAASGGTPEVWRAALAAIRPAGTAPLALALERAAADTAATYVLVTAGGGGCGGDPCGVWREVVAGAHGNRRARLHVVALAPAAEEVEHLRCLSRAGSGSFTVLADPDSAAAAGARIARVLRNHGLLDVRFTAGRDRIAAPVRLLRPLTAEVVARFTARGPREVPAGMYTVVVETTPPVTVERVMVLPGETALVARSDFGRLEVDVRDAADAPRRAQVSVRRPDRGEELRFVPSGEPITLRAGRYDVVVDLGDSLVARADVAIEAGRTTIVPVGGRGTLVVAAPGFDRPPPTRAFLYGAGRVDTLAVGEPVAIAAGHYRLVAQTVPVYVTEDVNVAAGRETRVALPELGVLGVDVFGPDGLLRNIRIDVREPMTQEVYGAMQSGDRRLAMPGIYDLELATVPRRTIDGVGVTPRESTVVERRGMGRVTVRPAAAGAGPLRLELLPAGGERPLAEATGATPAIDAWPGDYRARVWRGPRLVWDGRVTVAPSKSAPIDWARP